MRNVVVTSKFKKDFKLVQKTAKFKKCATKFESYVEALRTGVSLPASADDHQLAKQSPKEYSRCREFKAAPDLCIVYRMTSDTLELIRIGQHNNLGLTETF
jgi:addiction module RelE/StbE family toxin